MCCGVAQCVMMLFNVVCCCSVCYGVVILKHFALILFVFLVENGNFSIL